MKVAVNLSGLHIYYDRNLSEMLDAVRAMDAAGIDQIVTSEHVAMSEHLDQYPYGKMPAPIDFEWFDPLSLLSAVAATTRHIRLSTGILIAPLRTPGVLAKELATIDHLSHGRLDIGVGVGWQSAEFDVCGVPYEGRFGRLEEMVRICQALWRDTPASYSGKTISFDRIWSVPRPVQAGGVPIWFGLAPTERNFARIAQLGQGWLPYYGIPVDPSDPSRPSEDAGKPMFSLERLSEDVARLRRVCEDHGRDHSGMAIRMMIPPRFGPDGHADLERTLDQIPALAQAGLTMFEISPMTFCQTAQDVATFIRRIANVRA